MTTGPAAAGLVAVRAGRQQRGVNFAAAVLHQTPGAGHVGQLFERSNQAGCQRQRQHEVAQLRSPAPQAGRQQAEHKADDCQHADHDDRLLDPVVQDVFEEEAMAADKAVARHVEQV